jgi:hypothetical protein
MPYKLFGTASPFEVIFEQNRHMSTILNVTETQRTPQKLPWNPFNKISPQLVIKSNFTNQAEKSLLYYHISLFSSSYDNNIHGTLPTRICCPLHVPEPVADMSPSQAA